jgi:hypothetical protein
MRSKSLVLFVSLILTAMSLLAAPPGADDRRGTGEPDAAGFTGEHLQALAASPAPPGLGGSPVHACLELHHAGVVFPINVTINPFVNPQQITGGVLGGNLCDAANYKITDGSLGTSLTINATYHGTAPCAPSLTIQGDLDPPSSFSGTYNFSDTVFRQHTLFLGYVHGTAACP